MLTFKTLAELKSRIGSANVTAILLGNLTPADGGQLIIYWDKLSIENPDDVNIFKVTDVTTGRWKDLKLKPTNQLADTVEFDAASQLTSDGVLIIDFNLENRFLKYPNKLVEPYNFDADEDVLIIGFGKSWNSTTKILTLEGITGDGYISLIS